ncbi:MIF4G like-domain-containing protein [Microdochium trichocladiopsis]|uniref:MIF4G like-domain-containing protein n=1 Tax=Microdochium trichocladiopsis TaxID=1682393 RepID=A0A9P9BVA3_9PEZI|nr:MIF4G like-domain-containing protein [Microdochium trichocladiopsis]KAH7033132.1 MIF4G like-domain-containing protein [Microdochium trichocladiopsis]
MGDHENRHHGGGGGYGGRKRRYRDDDDYDRRNQRRRYDAPAHTRIRKQLLGLAETPLKRWHEEVQAVAQLIVDAPADDKDVRACLLELIPQMAVEQPLKTPFVAAVVLVVNSLKPELLGDLLARLASATQERIQAGEWREVKLYLKLLACLQACLEGDGLFPVLEELFSRAVDLQTASSDDTIGTEIVKIILLTIPYIMATGPASQWQHKAAEIMDKTDVIASEPHALQVLIDPYQVQEGEESPTANLSLIGLLQNQLQKEATNGWALSCLPRPWQMPPEEIEQQEKLDSAQKHALPPITIPETVVAGPRLLFPEIYFSVYANQEIESVPPTSDLASSLIRDGLVDTINVLHFNRTVTARFLIDVDCYYAPGTFVKRATPFDRLRDIDDGRSTWKPEDIAVDAVFSQLFQLPAPEQKLVYYHAVLTDACKLAPAAVAPSLGRAIRYMYQNQHWLDLELAYRFLDWFTHHLSNFGFMWKWAEWVNDVELPNTDPRKAFIVGALDKEIRLSFAQRIKGTLPEPYQVLIGPEKEQDTPDFKYNDEHTPFSAEGKELASLLKRKAPDEEIQPVIDRIHSTALDQALDPLVTSTDIFMTAVCWVGSKSLSHVLACIERTKDRLLDAGAASEAVRAQIITAVMTYWSAHPGIAVSIVEKLLNYSIVTPAAVIDWALVSDRAGKYGEALSKAWVFELVFNTVAKVTSRHRQVVSSSSGGDDAAGPDVSAEDEIAAMRDLFKSMDDSLTSWAQGTKDQMLDPSAADGNEDLVKRWGQRWLRVFRRKSAIEEAFLAERKNAAAAAAGAGGAAADGSA